MAEVYDLSSALELDWYENIGLCKPGEAEKLLNDGETTFGGRVPVNPSGGLACFGEAIPAQAIAQVCELTWQLRGQAEGRQVENAKAGVTANQGLFGHGSSVVVTKSVRGTIRSTSSASRATENQWQKHTSSMRFAPRSAARRRAAARFTRPTSARTSIKALVERNDIDPAVGRGRDLRLRRHHRPAGRRHRSHLLARRRVSRRGSGHDHRPAVRLVAAGGALRRAGGDERHQRPRRRRRRAEHEPDPDLVGDDRRPSRFGFTDPFSGSTGWVARYGDQEVSQFRCRRDDRGEVGHLARRHGSRSRSRATAARSTRSTRAASPRDRPLRRGRRTDEGPRRDTSLEKMAELADAARRRSTDRRGLEPDLRRRLGDADRLGARGKGTRPQAARPHPSHQRARRRPGVDADRADPGDRLRA